jgi:hypothetical protein
MELMGLQAPRDVIVAGTLVLDALDGMLPYPSQSAFMRGMIEMASSPVFQRRITDAVFTSSGLWDRLRRNNDLIFRSGDSIQSPFIYPSLGSIPITVDPWMPKDHIVMVNGSPGDGDFSVVQIFNVKPAMTDDGPSSSDPPQR